MTRRQNILVALAAALGIANLAWFGLSRSAGHERVAVADRVAFSQPNKPFRNPFPKAVEVRLFVATDYDADGEPIYSKPKGRVLTAGQRSEFESLIAVHTISPDESFAACFIPHHFFRYFDEAGKQIGEVQVCFCCAGVQQSEGSNVRLSEDQMLVADGKSSIVSLPLSARGPTSNARPNSKWVPAFTGMTKGRAGLR